MPDFAAALTPVALASLAITVVLIAILHPKEFLTRERLPVPKHPRRAGRNRPLVVKTLLVLLVMVGFFLAGFPIAGVAILGGAFLLFTRRVKAEKVYFDIDWPLLVMFAGLFIVVAGFDKAVIGPEVHSLVADFNLGEVEVALPPACTTFPELSVSAESLMFTLYRLSRGSARFPFSVMTR